MALIRAVTLSPCLNPASSRDSLVITDVISDPHPGGNPDITSPVVISVIFPDNLFLTPASMALPPNFILNTYIFTPMLLSYTLSLKNYCHISARRPLIDAGMKSITVAAIPDSNVISIRFSAGEVNVTSFTISATGLEVMGLGAEGLE